DLLASFVGVIDYPSNNRTGVRSAMSDALMGRSGFHLWRGAGDVAGFEAVMSRTVFALCPRGYGKTSFRLYESMQMGCVPVYIYDDPWLPYTDILDWSELAVLCHVSELSRL